MAGGATGVKPAQVRNWRVGFGTGGASGMNKVLLSQQSNPPLRDVNSKLATGGTYFVRGRWRLSGVESAAGGVSMHGGLAAGLRSLGSLGEVLGVKPVVQVVPGVEREWWMALRRVSLRYKRICTPGG